MKVESRACDIYKSRTKKNKGVGDIQAGEVDLEEYPIIMTFSKKESIDVIISELKKAKSYID